MPKFKRSAAQLQRRTSLTIVVATTLLMIGAALDRAQAAGEKVTAKSKNAGKLDHADPKIALALAGGGARGAVHPVSAVRDEQFAKVSGLVIHPDVSGISIISVDDEDSRGNRSRTSSCYRRAAKTETTFRRSHRHQAYGSN